MYSRLDTLVSHRTYHSKEDYSNIFPYWNVNVILYAKQADSRAAKGLIAVGAMTWQLSVALQWLCTLNLKHQAALRPTLPLLVGSSTEGVPPKCKYVHTRQAHFEWHLNPLSAGDTFLICFFINAQKSRQFCRQKCQQFHQSSTRDVD